MEWANAEGRPDFSANPSPDDHIYGSFDQFYLVWYAQLLAAEKKSSYNQWFPADRRRRSLTDFPVSGSASVSQGVRADRDGKEGYGLAKS